MAAWEWLHGGVRETRAAMRALRARPGYALLSIVTLGLGIGANTAVFSVVRGVLLSPLPFPEPDRLVQIWETTPERSSRSVAPANFLDWRERSDAFEEMASYRTVSGNLLGADSPERVRGVSGSGGFFDVVGVGASVGRVYTASDEHLAGAPATVLSHGLWTRRFGADPAVVGTTVRLDEALLTVVAVAPVGFDFPAGTDLWTRDPADVPSIPGFPGDIRQLRDAWYTRVVGRLAPGVEIDVAVAQLGSVAAALEELYPESNTDAGVRLVPLRDQVVGGVRSTLWLLFGAVTLVLLIACANVGNLALARATERSGDLAVRRALGADGRRLVTHVLAECTLLAAAGAALGLLGAVALVRFLARTVAAGLPGLTVGVDPITMLYASVVAAGALILFGALPAVAAARRTPAASLVGRAHTSSHRGMRAQNALVSGEMALAVVLVLSATLLTRTVAHLRAIDPGFEPDGLTAAWVSLPGARGLPEGERTLFWLEAAEALRALPGVTAVGFSQESPVAVGARAGLRVFGRTNEPNDIPDVAWAVVSTGYFDAVRTPLLEGRAFTAEDASVGEPVALVNETLARQVFGDGGAVGMRLNTGLDGQMEDGSPRWVRVIGVVADTRNQGPAQATLPMMYRPAGASTRGYRGESAMFAVRADVAPTRASLQGAIATVNSGAPVFQFVRGGDLAEAYLTSTLAVLRLLTGFSALAMILGAVGIYGVTSFLVRRRTREVGVRMALGSSGPAIGVLMLRRGVAPAVIGMVVGLAAAAFATRALESMLFGVRPLDPLSIALTCVALLSVAMGAITVPALRAARVDPVVAIRED